jgi:triosephosphate isomerase
MVKEAGATHAILGHSERRTDQGESNELIAQKVATAIEHGITPILCVGETQAERESHQTENVVDAQIQAVIALNGIAAMNHCILAYEPVWAIGTGLTASPEQAQSVHAFIRGQLAKLDSEVAAKCRILYGGSMKPENAAELMAQPDIDGGLIGGASLKSQDFLAICKAATKVVA